VTALYVEVTNSTFFEVFTYDSSEFYPVTTATLSANFTYLWVVSYLYPAVVNFYLIVDDYFLDTPGDPAAVPRN
jgi:hypothetical protein